MHKKSGGTDFGSITEPIIHKVLENIESPFVWMPLGLFVLCVLAYPIMKSIAFVYLSIGFVLLAFGADWLGRLQNRKTPELPTPQDSTYRDDILRYLSTVQTKAVEMLNHGKVRAAITLINKNFEAVEKALKTFPNDADFHSLMGYTLKDMYQGAKTMLPSELREPYLQAARKSFEKSLKLNPNNTGAHNGMGNVLFFEGKYDEAIKEHDKALELAGGHYPEAEHDREMVMKVRADKVRK